MRELGHVAAALEGGVAGVLGSEPPLSRRIHLRELQAAFVANMLLVKKARVRRGGGGGGDGVRRGLGGTRVDVNTCWVGFLKAGVEGTSPACSRGVRWMGDDDLARECPLLRVTIE